MAALLPASCSVFGEEDFPRASGPYAYTAFDSTGAAVVEGTLKLSFREAAPEHSGRFLLEGTFESEKRLRLRGEWWITDWGVIGNRGAFEAERR